MEFVSWFLHFFSRFRVNDIIYCLLRPWTFEHSCRNAQFFSIFFLLLRWSKSSVKQKQTLNKITSEGSWTSTEREECCSIVCIWVGFFFLLLLSWPQLFYNFYLGMWMWMFTCQCFHFHCASNGTILMSIFFTTFFCCCCCRLSF